MANISTISATEFANNPEHQSGLLIDVRSPAEFKAEYLENAQLNPLHSLDVNALCAITDSKTPVYLLCQSGQRANMAAEKLQAHLDSPLVVIEGGLNALKAEGVSTQKGQGVISLERQVRIAAGSLVVLGVVLSLTIAPAAIYLSAFVGAGLVFAGITNTCGMGMLLAKMPWNN